MAQFLVDPEQIQASSAAVSVSVAAIREAVAGMYTNLANLQNVWRGTAATEFISVSEQWRTAQYQMERSLQAIQHALGQASTVYTDAEVQASRLFAAG